MKKANEIQDLILEKREALKSLTDKATAEKRSLTDDEKVQFRGIQGEITGLDADLELAKVAEANETALRAKPTVIAVHGSAEAKADKDIAKYSVLRALSLAAQGKALDGAELEMHQQAKNEARSFGETIHGIGVPAIVAENEKKQRAAVAGTTTLGGFTIERTLGSLIDRVYDDTFMAKLGVKRITGLQGNVDFPVQSGGLSVAQYAENATIALSDLTWSQKSLSPVRIGAATEVSKQLLTQTSVGIESYIADHLAKQFQLTLESRSLTAILAAASAITISGDTNGIAPTYDHFLAMEEALAVANIRGVNFGVLTNPKVRKKLKGTTKLSNSITEAVWEAGDKIVGYDTAITNLVASNGTRGTATGVTSTAVMGDFSECISAGWGGMDYMVNPYKKSLEGLVEISCQCFNNELVTRDAAFIKYLYFLTT